MLKLKRQVSSLVVVLLSKIKYNKTQINMPSVELLPLALDRTTSKESDRTAQADIDLLC